MEDDTAQTKCSEVCLLLHSTNVSVHVSDTLSDLQTALLASLHFSSYAGGGSGLHQRTDQY